MDDNNKTLRSLLESFDESDRTELLHAIRLFMKLEATDKLPSVTTVFDPQMPPDRHWSIRLDVSHRVTGEGPTRRMAILSLGHGIRVWYDRELKEAQQNVDRSTRSAERYRLRLLELQRES